MSWLSLDVYLTKVYKPVKMTLRKNKTRLKLKAELALKKKLKIEQIQTQNV